VKESTTGLETGEMRIALCAAGEIWGGVEQFIETVALELHRRGVGFVVLLLNEGALARRLRDLSLPVEVVGGDSKYDPRSAATIGRALRRHRIDVVHVHGYKASILAGTAAKLQGRILVKTEHGKLEPFTGWGRVKMTMNLWLDETLSRKLLDAIVFVSRDIQRGLADRYRHIPQEVIYNAIRPVDDSSPADAAPALTPEGVFRIGIVGRLKPIKGHDVLLRALARPGVPAAIHLYVFGEGPLLPSLRALSKELGIEGRVTFLGFRENMPGYLRQLDAMAMPSRHEGIPYAALEAMATGVPLVASDVGGLREILEHDVDALLVPPEDPGTLADAVTRLYTDSDLRMRLIARARDKVNARFLAAPMVDRYLEVYRRASARS
jgi:glycosyltransferase involved in cell wall biosynthesis